MNRESPPSRRWLQFGLKTAVVVMLLCALFSGYTAWWMRRLQQAEDRAEQALSQAEKARRRAQQAVDRAQMAEVAARDHAVMAEAQAALSRQIQLTANAQLRALAQELENARAGRAEPRPDEGPVVAPPPEDEVAEGEDARDRR